MKTFYFLILSLTGITAWSQETRTRSNEVYLEPMQAGTSVFLPVIVWTKPDQNYTHGDSRHVKIGAAVTSKSAPLQRIVLSIGSNVTGEIWGMKELSMPPGTTFYDIDNQLYMPDGSSYIKILVEGSDGTKVSATKTHFNGANAEDWVDSNRKDYALLFATNEYDSWEKLVNPVADARAIADRLNKEYNFETQIVENPSHEEIIEKIREYSQRSFRSQDQLFIFFAGHGQFDEVLGEGYVVASNSRRGDKARSTYISHSNLRTYVNNIPCKHILLSMDVCFGGTFDPQIAKSRAIVDDDAASTSEEFIARKLSKTTRVFVTSGGKEYVPDGTPGHNSPFAARFLLALNSRGGADRILTLTEVKTFLEKIEANEPRFGDFGDNEKGSDFVFLVK